MKKVLQIITTGMAIIGLSGNYPLFAQDLTPRAQASLNRNYIHTLIPQTNTGDAGAMIETIQYFDGLGRSSQTVSWQASPGSQDIVTPVSYDIFDREDKKYLPYATTATGTGAFKSNALDDTYSANCDHYKFYNTETNSVVNDANPFAKTEFEASPLNRVVKQGAPGTVWQPNATPSADHSVKYDYGTNAAGEVKRWKVVSDALTDDGSYAASTLFKTITWDENNNSSDNINRTEEFTDLQGKVVLKRSKKGSETLSTYYVYDDFDLLRFVLTPKAMEDNAITGNELNDLCYQYKYDGRKRMIEKKLPGADWVYMVYDNRYRLAATQDGVQRAKSPNEDEWTFTKYDALNRPIMTGIYKVAEGTTPGTLKSIVNGFGVYSEDRSTTGYGYSNNSFPSIAEADLLAVTYYDTYDYPGMKSFTYNGEIGNNSFSGTKGQVTGTRAKVLDGTENNSSGFRWLVTTHYYDNRYRVIQTLRDLYAATTADNEVVSTLYDFTGKVMKTLTQQTVNGTPNTVLERNAYDNAGRLTQVKHKVNSGTEVILASMEYDEIGQLKQKSLHGEVSSGIQNLNYGYNIRGWLERINNPDVNPSLTSTQKLNLGLYYNNLPSGLSATAQYNGNIAGLVWNVPRPDVQGTLFPGEKEGYRFTYDGLNRMTNSYYGEGSTFTTNADANNENLTYDKNGNILTLTRNLKGTGLIDNLTYLYKNNGFSNMLDRVDDAVSGVNGFSEGNIKQAGEYNYDNNGNLTSDLNKGYSSIQYNYLNLPQRIVGSTQQISYIYDAAGIKLAKIGTGGAYTYYAGSFVYSGSSLSYILTKEGMWLPGGNYQYYLKDHLGNTRLAVNTSGPGGTLVQQTDYYPFGMDITVYNGGLDNRYRYNGKEFQEDAINNRKLDWYDYGARFYDPALGRWHTVDPLAEKSRRWSPYTYALDNPLRFTDPDGNDWWDAVVGTAYGIATNIVPGTTSLREHYTPTDAADYNNALRSTDAAALAVGEAMVKGGGGAAATGGAVALAGGAVSLSGIGATVGAPAAAIGVTVAEAGAATAAGGVVLMANGSANAAAGYNYGGQKDTESGSRKEAFRNAKDQNGIPRSQQPDKTIKPNTPEGNAAGLDSRNVKQYEFTNSQGQKVTIRQDKPATYNGNGTGDQGAHYNAGQNGEKLKQHHNYGN